MADEVVDLVRRFEPILIFHPQERFVPCDAKRYIEQCALWKAERPFDQKDSWGGKGQPFLRKPLIGYRKIAASNAVGEIRPGDTYLGTQEGSAFPFLIDNGEQRFLELGGWKGSVGVTQNSENRYADRNRVQDENTRPSLDAGRFWYHAELFNTERLERLTGPQGEPGAAILKTLIGELLPLNPALLCYYFFFLAHDESLPEPCDSQETGKEFASFAGEWACMAILLERESQSEPYRPSYIGHTCRFDADSQQGRDSERRFGMTVDKWSHKAHVLAEPLPRTFGNHPQIFVSLGVHSLHLQPGKFIIDPYLPEEAPVVCGRFDSPNALKEYKDSLPATEEEGSPAAAWAKILGGLFLGALPGLVAGAALTALEGLPLGTGFTGKATGAAPPEKPATDVGAEADHFGLVVHPKRMALGPPEFPATNFIAWNADQDVTSGDGRTYNFIVDRKTQIYWPSDDGKSGYRGRWGPLVVNDPLHRRSGMRFPEFWKMFFVGLAKKR